MKKLSQHILRAKMKHSIQNRVSVFKRVVATLFFVSEWTWVPGGAEYWKLWSRLADILKTANSLTTRNNSFARKWNKYMFYYSCKCFLIVLIYYLVTLNRKLFSRLIAWKVHLLSSPAKCFERTFEENSF